MDETVKDAFELLLDKLLESAKHEARLAQIYNETDNELYALKQEKSALQDDNADLRKDITNLRADLDYANKRDLNQYPRSCSPREAVSLMLNNRVIDAVKELRMATGLGLADSKHALELAVGKVMGSFYKPSPEAVATAEWLKVMARSLLLTLETRHQGCGPNCELCGDSSPPVPVTTF